MDCELCAQSFRGMNDLIQHVSTNKNHLDSDIEHFSCLVCSTSHHSIPDVVQHIESEEHTIMAMATGVHFAKRAESSDTSNAPFPPLDFCILCGSRTGKPYERHLQSARHKNIASLMRDICRKKTINYVSNSYDNHTSKKTKEFMNKIINMKQKEFLGEMSDTDHSLKYSCMLCQTHFNKYEFYQQHLKNISHKRMGQFLMKLSHLVKDLKVHGLTPDTNVTETFSNSFLPLYHCETCCIWIEGSPSYVRHISSHIHKRIDELSCKVTKKRKGEIIDLCLKRNGLTNVNLLNSSKDYCKLCAFWCTDGKQHVKEDLSHELVTYFIDSLEDESDKKFIKIYVEAQFSVKFGSTPPNYCKECNILFSKSEKYEQHLTIQEHKDIELSHPENESGNGTNEHTMKDYKISSPSVKGRHKNCKNRNRFCSVHGTRLKGKQMSKASDKKTKVCHRLSSRNASLLDFENRKTLSCHSSSQFRLNSNSSPQSNLAPHFRLKKDEIKSKNNFSPLVNCKTKIISYSRLFSGDSRMNGYSSELRLIQSKTKNNFYSQIVSSDYKISGNSVSKLIKSKSYSRVRSSCDETKTNSCYQLCYQRDRSNISSRPYYRDIETSSEFFCELCNYSSSNPHHYDEHLMSEEHKKLKEIFIKDKPFSDDMECETSNNYDSLQYNSELCDVANANSVEHQEDLQGQKDKKNQKLL